MEVNFELIKYLHKYIKRFKSKLLDLQYEKYKDYDHEQFTSFFMICITENAFLMKKYRQILLDNNCNEKEVNDLLYYFLKSNYKFSNGLFSFHEINELDLDFDFIKNTTTTYTIL
jgi:hypothetical protein